MGAGSLSFVVRLLDTMWGKGPPKDNVESWQDIQHFIAEFPDDDYWSRWKPMVRGVVSDLEARGLAPLIRVGQSMSHVILSTLEHHSLTNEPRVTLEFRPKEQAVRIAYSRSNLFFGEPMSQETVPISEATPRILDYLRRLWHETKPDTKIPDAISAA